MSGWRAQVAPGVVQGIAVVLGLFAAAELLTVLVALTWLDPSRLPGWLIALWVGRTGLYGLAARWLWSRERRGVWLAVLAMGTVLALWASPLDVWEQEQHGRRWLGVVLLAGLAVFGSSGTQATQPPRST